MLATISSHETGAKYTHKKLTDCGWEVDNSTITLEVELHFYTENLNFGNKKPATIKEYLLFS